LSTKIQLGPKHSNSVEELYLAAFVSIMPLYQESKTEGGLHALGELRAHFFLADNRQPARVTPSVSDFICDVELAAAAVLNAAELNYFNEKFRSTHLLVEETDDLKHDGQLQSYLDSLPEEWRSLTEFMDLDVRLKVGFELTRRGIYPLTKYVSPTHG
jgi:hypothetical protein